jgi:uncharacterized protein with GYD domain
MNCTPKRNGNPQNIYNDSQAVAQAVEQFGRKQIDWNLTTGPYDAVAKVEFPDDQASAAFILAVVATGNQETVTMKAFSLSEVKQIVEKIP